MSAKLMLASGKLSSYKVLLSYLNLLDDKEKSRFLPRSSDLEYIKKLIEEGFNRLDEIINELVKYLKERVNPDLACEAVKKALGIQLGTEEAITYVAKELASWIIEISESLNVVRIRGAWSTSE